MKKVVVIAGVALIAAIAVVFCVGRSDPPDVGGERGDAPRATKSRIKENRVVKKRPVRKVGRKDASKERRLAKLLEKGRKVRTVKPGHRESDDYDDDEHPYSETDKKVSMALQEAVDALCPGGTKTLSREAMRRFFEAAQRASRSSNPSVRQRAVDAYSWLGEEALPELTPLMADADAGVAESAIDAVDQALTDMDNSRLRFETAAAYMNTFTANEDALAMLSGTMTSAALDVIDAADDSPQEIQRARESRDVIVDSLSTIIESGVGKNVDVAKETYSDITSEDWVSREEAAKWAADPDNYEAPEAL